MLIVKGKTAINIAVVKIIRAEGDPFQPKLVFDKSFNIEQSTPRRRWKKSLRNTNRARKCTESRSEVNDARREKKLTNHYKRPPRNCLVSRKLEYDGMKKAFEELSRRQAEWEKQLDELAEEFIRAWKGEPY